MAQGSIGIVAAMPEEIAPLLKRVSRYRRERREGFTLYRFDWSGREVVLLQSGMGPEQAGRGTRLLIEAAAPRLILNYGFAGAVRGGLKAGDLVLAQQVLFLEGGIFREQPALDAARAERLRNACTRAGLPLAGSTFVTAAKITAKGLVHALLPETVPHPVLEMETAAVWSEACRAGVPLVAVRGISDPADEELDFSLEEFTDEMLRVRISRVLATVARKPRIVPQLMRLAANARKAGENLARCIEVALGGVD